MGCSSSSSSACVLDDIQTAQTFDEKYACGEELGQGCFGQVYAAHVRRVSIQPKPRREGGHGGQKHRTATAIHLRPAAVKVITLCTEEGLTEQQATEISKRNLRKADMEVSTWLRVGEHRHCVSLFEAFVDVGHAYMVMERCHWTLSAELRGRPLETQERSVSIISQMLAGIAHVHSLNIVHRDVKPDNFLMGGSEGTTVKIADFGLAVPMRRDCLLGGTHGTPAFMSPEMLLHTGYSAKTDVWSLGAMLHLLLYGEWAYAPTTKRSAEMKETIKSGNTSPSYRYNSRCRTSTLDPSILGKYQVFIESLLIRNPDWRPDAETALVELHEAVNLLSPPPTRTFAKEEKAAMDCDVSTNYGSRGTTLSEVSSPCSGEARVSGVSSCASADFSETRPSGRQISPRQGSN